MNILNGNEAFAAMMAGRNILCRAVGEMLDFNNIDQFPATIFAKPGYEFCIKVETMELAGITFTKPLTLDDVKEDMKIFLVYPDHVAHTKYTTLCKKYYECVRNGFAQADQENAELQLQAIGKLFGRTIAYPLTIESHIKIKKKRSTKTKNDADQASTPSDPDTATSNVVEEKTFESQSNIQIIEQGLVTAVEDSLIEEFVETDAVKLVEKFTAQINAAETVDAVMQIRYQLNANGHMVRGQIIELNKLGEKRIEALNESQVVEEVPADQDPVQLSQKVKSEYMVSLTGATQLDAIAILENEINKDPRLLDNHKGILHTYIETRRRVISEASKSAEKTVQVDEDAIHQALLNELLGNVANAATPMEANAQINYTKKWNPEQRKPLITAINKRLVELNPPVVQPSLVVRIQRAEDLTELDALEIDVSACDEEIQPRLMELVEKRRVELDPFTMSLGEP